MWKEVGHSNSGLKNICGIPVGAYFTLSGTVSDMAWIAAAGGA